MSDNERTMIRVRPGADDCKIENCTVILSEESNMSFVDTAAKNTEVKNTKVIQLEKKNLKIFFVTTTILSIIADGITVYSNNKHLWNYLF